jgi:hypothetical protein
VLFTPEARPRSRSRLSQALAFVTEAQTLIPTPAEATPPPLLRWCNRWPVALTALVLCALAWLWPIGIGGKMPAGGDVTFFSLGLMSTYRAAVHAGRLPLWNDLWGYGFPGLAESQMGVYYPPHIIIYGLLPLEAAYTVSLVAHTLWGAIGAYWAARRFQVSRWGAVLAGFVFAACGFGVIHLPHQWSYTAGSWMPWAWGLAWSIATRPPTLARVLALSAVLGVQVLPGHFQLAFETQLTVLAIAVWRLLDAPSDLRSSGRGAVLLASAWLGALFLAAAQIWPTARLASLAEAQRDYEYLTLFSATPLHIINYMAPGLFHRSALWIPLVWDPFRTTPKECLGYVGLVPLFLALGATHRRWRQDPATRLLAILSLGTMLLSLGRYVPGYAWLSTLPGFSFFRCPARWTLATSLALALLAAKGLDALGEANLWPHANRSVLRFALVAALAIGLILAIIEGALRCGLSDTPTPVSTAYDRVIAALRLPAPYSVREFAALATKPQTGSRVRADRAREHKKFPTGGLRWDHERRKIYARELGETALLLVLLGALGLVAHRRAPFRAGLVLLAIADLLLLAQHRRIDVGPIRPLESQSQVLARLAATPHGSRTVDPFANLPMVVGASPLAAYRSIDLPVVPALALRARQPIIGPSAAEDAARAMRASGARYRVLDAGDVSRNRGLSPLTGSVELASDRAIAGWLVGSELVAGDAAGLAEFGIWEPYQSVSRAWLVPAAAAPLALTAVPAGEDGSARVLRAVASATPCSTESTRPENLTIRVQASGAGLLIVSQLHDPEWQASLSGPSPRQTAAVERVFGTRGAGAWQGIIIPGAGDWTVHLHYRGTAARQGLVVSACTWGFFFLALGRAAIQRRPIEVQKEGAMHKV